MPSHHLLQAAKLAADLGVVSAAYFLAFVFGYEGGRTEQALQATILALPLVLSTAAVSLVALAIPSLTWRYVSLLEARRLFSALAAATAMLAAASLLSGALRATFPALPPIVLLLGFLLGLLGTLSVRTAVRSWSERSRGAPGDGGQRAPVPTLLIPAARELMAGRVNLRTIRDVALEDILRRTPVPLDRTAIAALLQSRRILVTGAGGSIGSELCREVCAFAPATLILVEQAENSLFHLRRRLAEEFPQTALLPCVAHIGDQKRMEHIFAHCRPELVFHAAAHKHVPLMEENPGEAVKNNILGTRVLADLAEAHQVRAFVMISTDKAVRPASVMGASKRVAEIYLQALAQRSATRFVTVRFGNVLGSSGSVLQIFNEQIARGGPLTVTHPDMMRYFMTIREACQLVLQAASMGQGREIFILDMGEPVNIVDLAKDLIRLSGRTLDEIPIIFTGIRPGEKLCEQLSLEEERVHKTKHPRIFIGRPGAHGWKETARLVEELRGAADCGEPSRIRAKLKDIVPEFQYEPAAAGVTPSRCYPHEYLKNQGLFSAGDNGDARAEGGLAHLDAAQVRSYPRAIAGVLKVGIDWVCAFLLLLLASPLILLATLAVRLTSRGPGFYTQTRLGQCGKPYTLYKIRTMLHNCEVHSGVRWATSDDPRITPVGRFLRRTHLDELPQLWNVLRGDMSLVGPRPERPQFVAQLVEATPSYAERLLVRPGVTGLAQVQLPADTDLQSVRRKLAYDLYYIDHQSLWLDVRILLNTVCKVVGIPFTWSGKLLFVPRGQRVELAYEKRVTRGGGISKLQPSHPTPESVVAACRVGADGCRYEMVQAVRKN